MERQTQLLRVLTPRLSAGQRVVVCGSTPELGNWDPHHGLTMQRVGIPLWSVAATLPAEYKFVIIEGDHVVWEEGENRSLADPGPLEFRGLPKWRASGVAVPVFSLRSNDDFGCGDFEDIKLLVDWAAQTGMELIQILPVNDTTMTRTASDSYPYSAISSFALHPLYLRPQLLAAPKEPEKFERLRRQLNAVDTVDYPAVIAAKEAYAREAYTEVGAATIASREFGNFVAANAAWLLPYCAFCVLRDAGRREPYSPGLVAQLAIENADGNFMFYAWLQYELHRQLLSACKYARSRGVAVKGDIPIGVSRDGVDAWQHPELFNLDMSAGAPPDEFAKNGQNWGFPTYNWSRMAEDGYAWWRSRLSHMSQYFDAYRIDHILGFFRIWEIPAGISSGLLGHFSPALPLTPKEIADAGVADALQNNPTTGTDVLFIKDHRRPGTYHPRILGNKTESFSALAPEVQAAYEALYENFFYSRHNDFWAESALSKLPTLVNATPMLACAEDLGMIPACVPDVLARLRILALEVQRMPKIYGDNLGDPGKYDWLNVATTSTHDMAPLRLWLEQRGNDSSAEACKAYLRAHTASPAMLAIIPLQDWLAADASLRRPIAAEEQINIPAIANHYWRYRMHLTLEEMLGSETLRVTIAKLATR